MKVILTILLTLGLPPLTTNLSAQTKRALVIGIGDYPKESGWTKINGNNDIEIITATLNAYGFNNPNIQTLKDHQATKRAIVSAFETLIGNASRGDIIYIHFSGHGQLITDVSGDELPSRGGYDESWIPYDARKRFVKGQYEGENHLIDDEINALLHQLRTAVGNNGDILVVVDACHSGGSTRGRNGEDVVVRGTPDKFIIPNVTRGNAPPNTTNWTTISASESYQSNFETRINGEWFGSLSYAIYSNKDNLNADSYLSIFSTLRETVTNLVRFPQTPVIENGNRNNVIFVHQ